MEIKIAPAFKPYRFMQNMVKPLMNKMACCVQKLGGVINANYRPTRDIQ